MADPDAGALRPREVVRRVPHLRQFDDDGVMAAVRDLTAAAPAYFWTVPAATGDHHHPLCRGDHGLWAHTLMVATVVERLADSYVERGLIARGDVDLARAAAVLHDQRKNGPPGDPAPASVPDHDLRMAAVVRESPLPDRVADAVGAHMGPWYDGPEPETPLADLVHAADMVASTATITPKVHGPVPEELAAIGVEGVPPDG
ncbi:MAG: HD domain-containing protein [Haloferacaceae archaeon]